MKMLLFILIATASFGQCNLTNEELKARNLTRDTTAYTWLINDPLTCVTQAFGRKWDGEIVVRDFPRALQLLAQNHQDSLFNKILLDRLLQEQNSLWVTKNSYRFYGISFSSSSLVSVGITNCVNTFQFRHSQTGELIEWKAPCKRM